MNIKTRLICLLLSSLPFIVQAGEKCEAQFKIPQEWSRDWMYKVLLSWDHNTEATLTAPELNEDINFLISILNDAYIGGKYLPASAFEQLLVELNQLRKETLTTKDLLIKIQLILAKVPDSHLTAYHNHISTVMKKAVEMTSLGLNIAKSNESPWKIQTHRSMRAAPHSRGRWESAAAVPLASSRRETRSRASFSVSAKALFFGSTFLPNCVVR